MNHVEVKENDVFKTVRSKYYNYNFDKVTGVFARWGETIEDDPQIAPYGPEILDIEISTSIHPEKQLTLDRNRLSNVGGCKGSCDFCYKSNKHNLPTYNMTFEEFKTIFDLIPKTLTQIAFGIMNIDTNPDFFKMMDYAKENGVVPNFTCHGLDDMTDELAKRISETCGAVAVSVYNKEKSYDTIKKLTDAGMTQVNIHFMICEETFKKAAEVMDDIVTDPRLRKLNAMVLLSLKQKGGGEGYTPLSFEKFCTLIRHAEVIGIRYGMDSCTATKYTKYLKEVKKDESMLQYVEPCESSLMSSYINAQGDYYACSFAEGEGMWKNGLSVLECSNFLEDIWFNDINQLFRTNLLHNNRACPLFKI